MKEGMHILLDKIVELDQFECVTIEAKVIHMIQPTNVPGGKVKQSRCQVGQCHHILSLLTPTGMEQMYMW